MTGGEQKSHDVVGNGQDLIYRCLADSTLTFVNDACSRHFGHSSESLLGRRLSDFVLPSFHEEMLLQFASAIVSRRSVKWKCDGWLPVDGLDPQEWLIHPIAGPQGHIRELEGIGRDGTDKKKVEEAMRNLAHASRLATMGELTALIAHEVSQPLNAILNNVEAAQALAKLEPMPLSELQSILADILADNLRAREVVARIRALSQKRDMDMKPLNINTVIDDVLRLVSRDAFKRTVQIRTSLVPELPRACGDSAYLQQALLNLIVNAMDALGKNSDGERLLTITTGKHNEEEIVVSVRDNGPGIKQETAARLFESFFSTKPEGIGLGLSLARSIVTAHGGRIWIENNVDRGVTFRFTLRLYMDPASAKSG